MFQKRGQITIFIIVGVLILIGLLLYFLIFAEVVVMEEPPSRIPRNFVEECVYDSVKPSIDTVFEYGGFTVPRLAITRNDHPYTYLCYSDLYHDKCRSMYPMLVHITESQIKQDSVERIEECFDFLEDDYRRRGFDVESEPLEYRVEIVPRSVRLRINKPMSLVKGETLENFERFDFKIPSDLYDIIAISHRIVNQEAEFCYFESNGFMVLYPKYNITRIDYLESKIYHIQNRQTKEVLKFATRSCAYAPGFENV
jgi:hypothetical protein